MENEILTPAQRAFIRNGGTHQCISTLLNILEDMIQKRKRNDKKSFYLVSYDMKKAYDRVQFFSIRPTLERFNLPESFIKYLENTQFSLRACFKTFYGLTEDFSVTNSIRQGDPLAPLIFVLFTDALHEGLKSSPIFTHLDETLKCGYHFLQENLILASLGFADDLTIVADSWEDIFAMHLWVLEFLEIHGGDLNASKTVYLISDAQDNDSRWLPTLDGMQAICPTRSDTPFRYLGIYVNMDLTWEKQISIISLLILDWGSKIGKSGISAMKALETYKTILLPKLDLGLTFATIDQKTLAAWSRKILRYIFRCDHRPTNLLTSMSIEGFSELTNCALISERYWNNHLKEFVYNLNSPTTLAGQSTYARLHSLLNKDQRNGMSLYSIKLTKRYRISRFAEMIQHFRKSQVLIITPPDGIKIAYEHVQNILGLINENKNIRIFTDGSTFPGNNTSGVGIHIEDIKGNEIGNYSFAVISNGDNFHAELVGLTIAAWAGRKMNSCEIYTDSQASMTLINTTKSQRDWIRTPSRGW
jgi:hypothetical protein